MITNTNNGNTQSGVRNTKHLSHMKEQVSKNSNVLLYHQTWVIHSGIPKTFNLKTNKGRLYLLSTTLQALQEIGLTKLPKLAKKTWADIASESNDEFETDLQIMIQNSKQSKMIVNPKGKQTLSQQKTPLPKPTNSYIYKNKFPTVL